MNLNLLKKLSIQMKNPINQLITVIIVGLIVVLYLFTTKTQPDFVEKAMLNQNIDNLEKQRNLIAQSPLPVKVDAKDIEALIVQVPTSFEISRLLLEFESIEQVSGALITELAIGDQEAEVKDELADYIEHAMKKAPVVSAAVPTVETDSAAAPEPAPAPIEPKLATPIKPEILSLTAIGTYPQVTEFLGQLYTIKRVVNIREWSLTPQVGDQYVIKLGLTVYTAPKYAGTFHDLPAISSDIPNKAGVPVMSNEEFMRIIESQP